MSANFVAEPTQQSDQNVPEHVAILDDTGRVVAFNEAWYRFAAQHGLRFNVGENYAQACNDAFGGSAESGSALAAGIRAVISGELPEFAAVLPAGEPEVPQWLRVGVHRVDGDSPGRIVVTQAFLEAGPQHGDPHDPLVITTDAEPSFHLEFAAHETADGRDDICHSLLQKVSRELRTPLNAVIGFSHLLLKEPLGERQLQKVRYVHEAGRTLLELVNNMLEFASLDRGDFELQEQAFDVRNLVQEVVALVQPLANDKHLPVRYLVADDVPTVVIGDRHRLRHVLVNLLNNAVKFTLRGHVLVEVASGGTVGRELHLRFRVSDTGVGIAPERRDQVFVPFAPVRDEISSLSESTGIGLALSRRLIERMGGSLGLVSEPGKGTTFEFSPVFQRAVCSDMDANADSATLPAPGDNLSAVDAIDAAAEQACRLGELETLGQAVIEQNWSTIERICAGLMDRNETLHQPEIAEQAFRLTLAARRRSPQRAREIYRTLALALAESQSIASCEH